MKIARALVACLFLAIASAAHAGDGPAGRYRLTGEHDVAAELLLRPDGTYEYALAAGSLDERSAGTWRGDGPTIHLTTTPKPVPPVFAPGAVAKEAGGPLILHVTAPDGQGIAAVDLRVGFDSGDPVVGYTQYYGWSLPEGETRTPRWVELGLEIYDLQSPRFPVDLGK